ncbi:hypothetical protein QVD99_007245 [Batrachochytrium dendrobatidis]|nr:hypothetical protein O5D80_008594 [Batrachochytrium dendrobatidis]KAK5665595.1 hypothetical protein QVD99_007245 [Batrachochytrium dendrobatidis]
MPQLQRNSAQLALQTPEILTHILAFTDDPFIFSKTDRSTLTISRNSNWIIKWVYNHPDQVLKWGQDFIQGYTPPVFKLDWVVAVESMRKPVGLGKVAKLFVKGGSRMCGKVCAAAFDIPCKTLNGKFIFNLNNETIKAEGDAALGATWRAKIVNNSNLIQQFTCLQQTLWIVCAYLGAVEVLEQIFNLQTRSSTPTSLTLFKNFQIATSLDLLKPTAFAAVQYIKSPNPSFLKSIVSLIPAPTETLKDLHYFSMRVGHVPNVQCLIEQFKYQLDSHVVHLLNYAQQNKNTALIDYILTCKIISEDVAEAVESWRHALAIQNNGDNTESIEQIIQLLSTRMHKCITTIQSGAVSGLPMATTGSTHTDSSLKTTTYQRIEVLSAHWKALLEIACAKGHILLVQGLLKMALDPEIALYRLEITVKMIAVALNGEYENIVDALVDSIPRGYGMSRRVSALSSLMTAQNGTTGGTKLAVNAINNNSLVTTLGIQSAFDKAGLELLGNLPLGRTERRQELMFRYCSFSDLKLFQAIFPSYYISEFSTWVESVKVHRIEMITFLLSSGFSGSKSDASAKKQSLQDTQNLKVGEPAKAVERVTPFYIRNDCIWAAFQSGLIEIAQVLQSAGGNLGWMEELSQENQQPSLETQEYSQHIGSTSRYPSTTPKRTMPASALAVFSAYGGQTDTMDPRAIAAMSKCGDVSAPGTPSIRDLLKASDEHLSSMTGLDRLAAALATASSSSIGSISARTSSTCSSRDGGFSSKRSSLLLKTMHNAPISGTEDLTWNAYLAGNADESNYALSWMEPRTIAPSPLYNLLSNSSGGLGLRAALAATRNGHERKSTGGVYAGGRSGSMTTGGGSIEGSINGSVNFNGNTMADAVDAYTVYAALGGELY